MACLLLAVQDSCHFPALFRLPSFCELPCPDHRLFCAIVWLPGVCGRALKDNLTCLNQGTQGRVVAGCRCARFRLSRLASRNVEMASRNRISCQFHMSKRTRTLSVTLLKCYVCNSGIIMQTKLGRKTSVDLIVPVPITRIAPRPPPPRPVHIPRPWRRPTIIP